MARTPSVKRVKAAATSAVAVSSNTASDVTFDTQLGTFQENLELRRDAEQRVKASRQVCIDILNGQHIDLRGKAMQPEDLPVILEKIAVMEEPKPVSEEYRLIRRSFDAYRLENLLNGQGNRELAALIQKRIGKKGVEAIREIITIATTTEEAPKVNVKATKALKEKFTKAFATFRTALVDYETAKATIDDVSEYVGMVEKIANISNAKRSVK